MGGVLASENPGRRQFESVQAAKPLGCLGPCNPGQGAQGHLNCWLSLAYHHR